MSPQDFSSAQNDSVSPVTTPPVVLKEEVRRAFGYWRSRILYALILGYATFYIVRQNFQVAAPSMLRELGYTRCQIGWAFSSFAIIYGFGKFISGVICDRTSARYFMVIGLLGASLCSLFIGCSHSITVLAGFYALNGAFQSMGWPPIARLMVHWYSPRELGTHWGIVNASHQVGSVIILLGGSWLLVHWGWRSVFLLPAGLAFLISAVLFQRLRDIPESLGLPSIEDMEGLERSSGHEDSEVVTLREILLEHIFPNPSLWYVCCANFFLYIVRMGFFNWAPTFLQEARGASVMMSGIQSMGFELMGALGGLSAGWISDRLLRGKRTRTCVYFMSALIVVLLLFWWLPLRSATLNMVFLFILGFLVYGPQTLAGCAGAEFGSKRAAAAGNGLTGLFGYLGAAFSGWGVGKIVDVWGWDAMILFFSLCTAISMGFFMLNGQKARKKLKAAQGK
ncbi:MAG: MFS transporter [Puniceicoccales bacterium]|jgi:phosphoglycerate transporter family protein|nr:MFS transporter [Puniceicoccales bacterium]